MINFEIDDDNSEKEEHLKESFQKEKEEHLKKSIGSQNVVVQEKHKKKEEKSI